MDFLLDLLFDIMIYIKLLLVPAAVIFLIVLFKKVSCHLDNMVFVRNEKDEDRKV
ncbi:MAG: hypothetical protein ACLU9N_10710 [Clostridia bacterium]